MPDLTPAHALTVLVLLISIAGLVWVTWRMDCRARRLEAHRLAQEASYREAKAGLERAIKDCQGARPLPGRLPPPPDFRYTPE